MFLYILGLALAVFAVSTSGCASSNTYRTRPVVTERVLDASDDTIVNGSTSHYKTVQCPSEGACNVEWRLTFNRQAEVQLPAKKRGCIPPMLLAGLVGTAGGAAFGSIMYPNDVEVSDDRVDVWFDPTWKFAAFGAATSTVITGVICYATR